MGIENTPRFDKILPSSVTKSTKNTDISDSATVASLLGKSEFKLERQENATCLPMMSSLKKAFHELANTFRRIEQKIMAANTGSDIPILSLKELAIMCNPDRHTPLTPSGISLLHQSLMPTPDNKISPRMQTLITHAIQDIGKGGHNLAKLQERAPDMYALLMSEVLTRGPALQTTAATALVTTDATYDLIHNRGNTLNGLLHPNNAERFQTLARGLGDTLIDTASSLPKISGELLLALHAQPVIDTLRHPDNNLKDAPSTLQKEKPLAYKAVMREILSRAIPLDTDKASIDTTLLRTALMEDRENGSPILIEMGQNSATKTRFSDLVFNYIDSPAEAMDLFRSAQPEMASELATRYAHNCATLSNDHQNQTIAIDFVKLSHIVDDLIHAGLDIDSAKEILIQATRSSPESLDTEIEKRIPETSRTGDMQDYDTVLTAIFNETVSTESQRLMAIANTFKQMASAAGTERELFGQLLDGLDPAYLPAFESAAKTLGIEIPYTVDNDGKPCIDLEKIATRRDALKPLVLTDLQQYAALKTLTIDTLTQLDTIPDDLSSNRKLADYFTSQLPSDGSTSSISSMLSKAYLSAMTDVTL